MSVEEAHSHFPPLPPGTLPLWAGLVGAPAAWAVQMQTIYGFAAWACAPAHRAVLILVNLVCLLAAGGAVMLCLRYSGGSTDRPDFHDRTRFLAHFGALTSALLSLLIIAQFIATVMLDPCAS